MFAMLDRILEAELMDTAQDAREYDAMDHASVNAQFATDLLSTIKTKGIESSRLTILDLGAGTAQIPVELCRRDPQLHVVAIDAAESMLAVARENVAAAGLDQRIELVRADAKALSTQAVFPVVISNSILHHIAAPQEVIAEAVRVAMAGGLLFHRDLARPRDDAELTNLVDTYGAVASDYQRQLFADSLRAALTLEEIRDLVAGCGFAPATVQRTSDRHWTWSAVK